MDFSSVTSTSGEFNLKRLVDRESAYVVSRYCERPRNLEWISIDDNPIPRKINRFFLGKVDRCAACCFLEKDPRTKEFILHAKFAKGREITIAESSWFQRITHWRYLPYWMA